MRPSIRGLVTTFFAVTCLSSPPRAAEIDESYASLLPLSGDVHRHAGSLDDHVSLINGGCPHESGEAPTVYQHLKDRGYDWVNLSHHINAASRIVDSQADAAYVAWSNGSLPSRTDPVYGYTLQPNQNGLPDYLNGGVVNPPYNEAKSLSSAAELRSVPGSFAAFAGREWTRIDNPTPYPGHAIAIPVGTTTEPCSRDDSVTPCNGSNETHLYQWIHRSGGVLVKAHPRSVQSAASFYAPWNPSVDACQSEPPGCADQTSPVGNACGFSDRVFQGIEVGSFDGGALNGGKGTWEVAYRVGLGLGYRLFPAFGSDLHQLHSGPANCNHGQEESNLAHGATICWTEGGTTWTRADVIDAMKARRCYYSSGYEPVLQLDACTEPTCSSGPIRVMGERIDVTGDLRVRVSARNDTRSQPSRRMRLIELVGVVGPGAVTVLQSNPCLLDDDYGDLCYLDTTFPFVAAGAIYARACDLAEGQSACIEGNSATVSGLRTIAISAPIFVNWTAYRTTVNAGVAPTCEFRWDRPDGDYDDDLVYDACDNCAGEANLTQANNDADALGDPCDADDDNDGVADFIDARPMEFDANQDSDNDGLIDPIDQCPFTVDSPLDACVLPNADGDEDGVCDLCDNCIGHPNPRVASVDKYLCANPWATLTGGQRDDDGDGFGNRCDAKFTSSPPEVGGLDFSELVQSRFKPIGGATCGSSSMQRCPPFDLNGDRAIDNADVNLVWLLQGGPGELWGSPPGPKCPTCPVSCADETSGICSP